MLRIGASLLVLATLSACGGAEGPANKAFETASITTSYTMLQNMQQQQNFTTASSSQRYKLMYGQNGGASEFYEGDQPQANDAVQITYNPRDLVYVVQIKSAGIDQNVRFQDPMHRTNFPQTGVPSLANVRYLEAGSAGDVKTLFFEQPGTRTSYVTWAGFYRQTNTALQAGNAADHLPREEELQRSAFVYGMRTTAGEVPKTGGATYSGSMFAWIVDHSIGVARTFNSISGSSQSVVDFAAGTIGTTLTGTVVETGANFSAVGSSRVTAATSAFAGSFSSLSLGGVSRTIGASTIEGGFYGPAAGELGAAFRIIGPVPDQRLDITGAFTGKP